MRLDKVFKIAKKEKKIDIFTEEISGAVVFGVCGAFYILYNFPKIEGAEQFYSLFSIDSGERDGWKVGIYDRCDTLTLIHEAMELQRIRSVSDRGRGIVLFGQPDMRQMEIDDEPEDTEIGLIPVDSVLLSPLSASHGIKYAQRPDGADAVAFYEGDRLCALLPPMSEDEISSTARTLKSSAELLFKYLGISC